MPFVEPCAANLLLGTQRPHWSIAGAPTPFDLCPPGPSGPPGHSYHPSSWLMYSYPSFESPLETMACAIASSLAALAFSRRPSQVVHPSTGFRSALTVPAEPGVSVCWAGAATLPELCANPGAETTARMREQESMRKIIAPSLAQLRGGTKHFPPNRSFSGENPNESITPWLSAGPLPYMVRTCRSSLTRSPP